MGTDADADARGMDRSCGIKCVPHTFLNLFNTRLKTIFMKRPECPERP